MTLADHEFVDSQTGALVRRLTVAALDTNCWIVADPPSKDAVGAERRSLPDWLVGDTSEEVTYRRTTVETVTRTEQGSEHDRRWNHR